MTFAAAAVAAAQSADVAVLFLGLDQSVEVCGLFGCCEFDFYVSDFCVR